jgi:hypothetical protein
MAVANTKMPKHMKKMDQDESSAVDVPWSLLDGGRTSMIGICGFLSIPSLVKSILYSSCNLKIKNYFKHIEMNLK